MRRSDRSEECVTLIRRWIDKGQTSGIRRRLLKLNYGNSSIQKALLEFPNIVSEGDGRRNTRRWVERK